MQKPSSTQNKRGQVERLINLASMALEKYELPAASLSPLKQVYNKNFHITARDGEQYMLRMCHPRRTSVDVVRSELLWLEALNRETDLRVPEPFLNCDAQYVTVVADAEEPRNHVCVLFHWINGRFLSSSLTAAHLFQVGELIARLHLHAAHWTRPGGFTRPRVENLFSLHQEEDDNFDDSVAEQAVKTVAEISTAQDGKLVEAVIKRAWAVLKNLGEGPETYGLIHADVHQTNYLFHRGKAGLIDFDDCGYGHWLYDLAVTLYCLKDHDDLVNLRTALLAGYRRVRPLKTEDEELLGAFIALRTLQDMFWIIEERDQSAFRDRWHAQTSKQLQMLEAW